MTMILIRMLTSISGIGIELSEGDEELFPVEDARRFVESGAAEPADEDAAAALAVEMPEPVVADEDEKQDGGQLPPAEEGKPALAFADLSAARKAYHAAFGNRPGPRWSIEEIAAKIAVAS